MTALDAALEAVDRCIPEPREEDAAIIRAKLRGLIVGYDARWKNDGWETLEIEQSFHLPVINPDSGHPSRTFTHAGKKDGIVRWPASGKRMLKEHKTCNEDISDPNAPYWQRLEIDSQLSHYMLSEWQSGRKLDGTLFDVTRKPGIKPRDISKANQRLLVVHGEYFGQKNVPLHLRNLDHENADLFELRLISETLEKPNFYFGRRIINRMDDEIVEFSRELWDVGQSILDARNKDAHYRNSNSCNQYNSVCPFLGVCSKKDTLQSDKWIQNHERHPELDIETDDGGLSVLTNSRIKDFQSCRRKHFYKYELGYRRADEEEREALFFGTCWHKVMEAWWECFRTTEAVVV